jgi:hypothetical protein
MEHQRFRSLKAVQCVIAPGMGKIFTYEYQVALCEPVNIIAHHPAAAAFKNKRKLILVVKMPDAWKTIFIDIPVYTKRSLVRYIHFNEHGLHNNDFITTI